MSPGFTLPAAASAPLAQFRVVQGRQYQPIADRAAPPFGLSTQLSDGVITTGTARLRHTAIQTSRGIILGFSNWYNNAGAETDGPQDITLGAAIEPATTKIVQLSFGGARQVVIKPGCTVYSDPCGVSLYKGQQFFSRTYVSIATAATKFPLGGYTCVAANGEGHSYGTPGTDLTTAGSATPSTNAVRVFGPSAIMGLPATPGATIVGIAGDSIAAGTGDSGAWLDGGWVVRALNLNYPYQSIALPSQIVDGWYAQEGLNKSRQQALLERAGPSVIICEMGVNGLSAGLATWQAHMIGTGTKGIWSCLGSFGVPIYQSTITPQTTSTDSWVTVGNQTVASAGNETARVAINAWLRDGAPITAAPSAGGAAAAVGASGVLRVGQTGHPVTGVLEVADLAESARDSGKWKANYSTDGTHPNATAAAALSAALSPTSLGFVAAA